MITTNHVIKPKTYFSSDWHLEHKNIIKYDNRPFKSIEEMNNTIIKNYNDIVSDDDDFYFLGDFCFNDKRTEEFIAQLKGNLFFIKGNHDNLNTINLYEKYGIYLGEQSKITVNKQDIVLNHYAMKVWNRSHYGAYCLYGHSHGSLPDDPTSLSFDVGCMIFDYKPIEFEQVKKIISKKKWKAIDHHKGR